jgi:large subunit ribosomal protein L15
MNIQDLRPAEGAKSSVKRVGRGIGSGMGKTSTRGHKGQWARSGGGVRPGFEGGQTPIYRRISKRGFTNTEKVIYEIVNVEDIAARFEDGATVCPKCLANAGLIRKENSLVKILARGTVDKKFTVKANKFSKAEVAAIEAAVGTTEVI